MARLHDDDMFQALGWSLKKYVDLSLKGSLIARKEPPLDPDVTDPEPKPNQEPDKEPVREPAHDPVEQPIRDTKSSYHMDC